MPLTLTEFLWLVLTLAAVVAVTTHVIFTVQMRRTAREGEAAFVEIRSFVANLQQTAAKVDSKVDDIGQLMDATKKTASGLSQVAWFLSMRLMKPGPRFAMMLLPFIRLGWQLYQKREGKNVR